jgi:tetratricopeptide (TPR) repeat protein
MIHNDFFKNKDRLLENIKRYVKVDNFKCAIEACNTFLKIYPNDLEILMNLGYLYFLDEINGEHVMREIEPFIRILKLDPQNTEALFWIGYIKILYPWYKEEEGIESLQKVISIGQKKEFVGFANIVLSEEGSIPDMIREKYLLNAIQIFPLSTRVHYNSAKFYYKLEKYQKVLIELEKISKLSIIPYSKGRIIDEYVSQVFFNISDSKFNEIKSIFLEIKGRCFKKSELQLLLKKVFE